MKPAPSRPSCTFFSMSHGYIASNTLSSACSQCSRLQTSSRHSITTSFAPSSKQAAQSARPKSAQSTGQRTTTVCPFCTLMPTPATNCAYCFNNSFFMFSPASVFGSKGPPLPGFPVNGADGAPAAPAFSVDCTQFCIKDQVPAQFCVFRFPRLCYNGGSFRILPGGFVIYGSF